MISIYTGTPGSGKSLHIAQRIYHTLKRGRIVIANFPVNLEKIDKKNKEKLHFFEIDNQDLNPQYLIEFAYNYWSKTGKRIKEDEILLVVDEAQIIYNSREWQTGLNRSAWLSFYSQHRKYGYEVVLIAQFDGMIDKQIRSLIEYNYIHRKASNFGIGGKFISLFGAGKLFVAVKMWYPLNEKVGAEFFRAKKKYYSIYDTFANFLRQREKIKKDLSFSSSSGAVDSGTELASGPDRQDEERKKQAVV